MALILVITRLELVEQTLTNASGMMYASRWMGNMFAKLPFFLFVRERHALDPQHATPSVLALMVQPPCATPPAVVTSGAANGAEVVV
jgi:hypothetical protein